MPGAGANHYTRASERREYRLRVEPSRPPYSGGGLPFVVRRSRLCDVHLAHSSLGREARLGEVAPRGLPRNAECLGRCDHTAVLAVVLDEVLDLVGPELPSTLYDGRA